MYLDEGEKMEIFFILSESKYQIHIQVYLRLPAMKSSHKPISKVLAAWHEFSGRFTRTKEVFTE